MEAKGVALRKYDQPSYFYQTQFWSLPALSQPSWLVRLAFSDPLPATCLICRWHDVEAIFGYLVMSMCVCGKMIFEWYLSDISWHQSHVWIFGDKHPVSGGMCMGRWYLDDIWVTLDDIKVIFGYMMMSIWYLVGCVWEDDIWMVFEWH